MTSIPKRLSTRRLAAVSAVSAVSALSAAAALAPAASASGAPAAFAAPNLPAFHLPSFADFPLATAGFTPGSLSFVGPQVAIGPTVIGSVFNGGTSVVVTTAPPVNSGNVIGSP